MTDSYFEPELAVERYGVRVWYCHDDDKITAAHWFTIDPLNCNIDALGHAETQFDARELAFKLKQKIGEPVYPLDIWPPNTPGQNEAIVRLGIDHGLIGGGPDYTKLTAQQTAHLAELHKGGKPVAALKRLVEETNWTSIFGNTSKPGDPVEKYTYRDAYMSRDDFTRELVILDNTEIVDGHQEEVSIMFTVKSMLFQYHRLKREGRKPIGSSLPAPIDDLTYLKKWTETGWQILYEWEGLHKFDDTAALAFKVAVYTGRPK